MAAIAQSVVIEAPVERVFSYMEDPAHQADIASGATRLEAIERFEEGGIRSRFIYEIAGMEFSGRLETVEYAPNHHITFRLSGKLEGHIWWRFEALGPEQSRMTYRAEYDLAVPLLGDAIAGVAAEFNRQEIDTQLSNLKRILEAEGRD